MAGSMGRALIQTTLQDSFTVVDRRLSQIDARERGNGRTDWLPVASDPPPEMPPLSQWDNAVPSWRVLNDGRVELRGRLTIPTQVVNGQIIMCISLWYYPYPDGHPQEGKAYRLPSAQPPKDSSVLITLPCASTGSNPGVIRADVVGARRAPLGEGPDPEWLGPDTTYIIARPPESQPLTGWIGFDHATFDPHLYIDAMSAVAAPARNSVFGTTDYGLAVLSQGGTNRVAIPGEVPMEWVRPSQPEEPQ